MYYSSYECSVTYVYKYNFKNKLIKETTTYNFGDDHEYKSRIDLIKIKRYRYNLLGTLKNTVYKEHEPNRTFSSKYKLFFKYDYF